MLIELVGVPGDVSYRNGNWLVKVELRQPSWRVELNGYGDAKFESYRILSCFELNVSAEDAKLFTTGERPSLRFLVEVAQ